LIVGRSRGGWLTAFTITSLLLASPAVAAQPPDPGEADTGETVVSLTNLTRAEVWRYFDPPPDQASDPDYAFVGNRSTLSMSHREGRWRAHAALRYVRIEPLPERALGPGPLGAGGLYQFHAQSTFSYQLYFPELNLGVEMAPGVEIAAGRFGHASSGEASTVTPSGPMERPDSRLLGTFTASMYERAFDGLRVDVSRPAWRLSMMAAMPTQGAYEESANVTIPEIQVGHAQLSLGRASRRSTRVFAYVYRDRRDISVRPDNTRRTSHGVDVTIWTVGASHAAITSVPSGELDTVVWGAAQGGAWYELTHRAWSAAAETGHRWLRTPGQPWIRVGVLAASGDSDPGDGRHATFFPMLPTAHSPTASTVYTAMNLVDVFGQLILEPHSRLRLAGAVRRVSLASSDDRWYAGSGATMRTREYFGYSTRASGGGTGLGTVAEATADVTLSRFWTVRAFLARIHGGEVVRHSFAGDRLTFFALDHVLRF
jgi:hypothetical protein